MMCARIRICFVLCICSHDGTSCYVDGKQYNFWYPAFVVRSQLLGLITDITADSLSQQRQERTNCSAHIEFNDKSYSHIRLLVNMTLPTSSHPCQPSTHSTVPSMSAVTAHRISSHQHLVSDSKKKDYNTVTAPRDRDKKWYRTLDGRKDRAQSRRRRPTLVAGRSQQVRLDHSPHA